MKILYAGMKYDYGDPNRGLSFEHCNFYDTLQNMDLEILTFDCMSILKEVGKKEMNRRLLDMTVAEQPDLLFTILMRDEFDKKTIKRISDETKTVTFNWFCDDHWRYDNFSRFWAPMFNWVSTTDSDSLEKYERDGYQNVIKTQWGVNPFLYQKKNLEMKYDVTFVGQVHSNRKKLMSDLKKKGIEVQCFGADWPNGRVSQDEMINIFNQSKINLNLSNSSTNKWYRFWKKDRDQIKGRNFEVPGTGGFLLTGIADNLDQYFELEKEVAIYNDEDDLAEKISYYLDHEPERSAISEAGYQRCFKDHSYALRFETIFKTIFP